MLKRTCLIAPMSVLLFPGVALAQTPAKYPAAVQGRIDEMNKMCSQFGKPVESPDLVTVADLTGDGVPDYVIDEGAFQCDGAASLFSGSGGSQLSVYVGTPDGQAFNAFGHGVFGVKLDKDAKPAKVYLGVGGPLCGQHITPNMPRVNYKPCWRPLQWNPGNRKMEFAPVSQIKPYSR